MNGTTHPNQNIIHLYNSKIQAQKIQCQITQTIKKNYIKQRKHTITKHVYRAQFEIILWSIIKVLITPGAVT